MKTAPSRIVSKWRRVASALGVAAAGLASIATPAPPPDWSAGDRVDGPDVALDSAAPVATFELTVELEGGPAGGVASGQSLTLDLAIDNLSALAPSAVTVTIDDVSETIDVLAGTSNRRAVTIFDVLGAQCDPAACSRTLAVSFELASGGPVTVRWAADVSASGDDEDFAGTPTLAVTVQ